MLFFNKFFIKIAFFNISIAFDYFYTFAQWNLVMLNWYMLKKERNVGTKFWNIQRRFRRESHGGQGRCFIFCSLNFSFLSLSFILHWVLRVSKKRIHYFQKIVGGPRLSGNNFACLFASESGRFFAGGWGVLDRRTCLPETRWLDVKT